MPKSPQPSIRAASISSEGIESRYWRRKKTAKPLATCGAITPQWVLIQPRSLTITNSGIIVTCPGIIIVER